MFYAKIAMRGVCTESPRKWLNTHLRQGYGGLAARAYLVQAPERQATSMFTEQETNPQNSRYPHAEAKLSENPVKKRTVSMFFRVPWAILNPDTKFALDVESLSSFRRQQIQKARNHKLCSNMRIILYPRPQQRVHVRKESGIF